MTLMHRRVTLHSGGWAELQVEIDPDLLTLEDWHFIWDLEQQLVRYEQHQVDRTAPSTDATAPGRGD